MSEPYEMFNGLSDIPIALIALIMHLRSGLINKMLVKSLVLGGIIGAVIGTLGANIIASSLLRKLYALFLLAFGLRELFGSADTKDKEAEAEPDTRS